MVLQRHLPQFTSPDLMHDLCQEKLGLYDKVQEAAGDDAVAAQRSLAGLELAVTHQFYKYLEPIAGGHVLCLTLQCDSLLLRAGVSAAQQGGRGAGGGASGGGWGRRRAGAVQHSRGGGAGGGRGAAQHSRRTADY